MGNSVRDFEELRVYRSAFESAMGLFTLSREWPGEERYRHVCAQLVTMINQRDMWCDLGPPDRSP